MAAMQNLVSYTGQRHEGLYFSQLESLCYEFLSRSIAFDRDQYRVVCHGRRSIHSHGQGAGSLGPCRRVPFDDLLLCHRPDSFSFGP